MSRATGLVRPTDAAAGSRLVGSLRFGISPGELLVFTAVAVGSLGLVEIACLFPAARASAVDPVDAMRAD